MDGNSHGIFFNGIGSPVFVFDNPVPEIGNHPFPARNCCAGKIHLIPDKHKTVFRSLVVSVNTSQPAVGIAFAYLMAKAGSITSFRQRLWIPLVMNKKHPSEKNRAPSLERPWSADVDSVIQHVETDVQSGLTAEQVNKRREEYGPNHLKKQQRKSMLDILLHQFRSLIMLFLAAAAALSFSFNHWVDGCAILVAILINAAIGFFTELKAVRSMEALQQMDRVQAHVLRGGQVVDVSAQEIVPGDILEINSGDIIVADLRLIESNKLQVNESTLTGESIPIPKQTDPLEPDTDLAERSNMLYKGTAATRGTGRAVAVATGMNTELGTISELVESGEERGDPLQYRLNTLARRLLWLIIGISVIVALSGIMAGQKIYLMVETGIALIIAAIPEGLPIVATIALAKGMKRMADQNALVRRLTAVQTLGSVNIIFTDKTGTLTENRMTLTRILTPEKDISVTGSGLSSNGDFMHNNTSLEVDYSAPWCALVRVGVLCSNASISRDTEPPSTVGDPMEAALLAAGEKAGLHRSDLLNKMPEEREVAFSSDTKMMATFHAQDKGMYVAVKGSPESVLDACTSVRTENGKTDLTDEQRSQWNEKNTRMAGQGLRVLAFAERTASSTQEEPYGELTFLGLGGLMDPPRPEIGIALSRCRKAGIRPIMVTGDQAETARSVGKDIGLIHDEDSNRDRVREGAEIRAPEAISATEAEQLREIDIFFRVTPEQKLNLISLHQHNGAVAGMTGDGVNDAPALKRADIGIAMGRRGSEVAKEAGDIILQDDAFPTILTAVKHGRTIFNNIRSFVIYLLSGNLGEILIVAIAAIAGMPLPLLPLQILYLNAINDVFPALALGLSEEGPDVMEEPVRSNDEPILTSGRWLLITIYSILIAATVLSAFLIALHVLEMNTTAAVTVSFLTLALSRLWHVFNMRDMGTSFFRNQLIRNPFIWYALALCTLLIIMAVFIPGLSHVLELRSPDVSGWLVVGVMSLVPFAVGQVWRSYGNRFSVDFV